MRTTSTFLVALILVFTFPIWIGIAGGIFGLIAGLFGAIIGIGAGLFGAIFGVIGGIFSAIGGLFGWLFDWSWGCHWPFNFWNGKLFVIAAIVLAIIVVTRSRKI